MRITVICVLLALYSRTFLGVLRYGSPPVPEIPSFKQLSPQPRACLHFLLSAARLQARG